LCGATLIKGYDHGCEPKKPEKIEKDITKNIVVKEIVADGAYVVDFTKTTKGIKK